MTMPPRRAAWQGWGYEQGTRCPGSEAAFPGDDRGRADVGSGMPVPLWFGEQAPETSPHGSEHPQA